MIYAATHATIKRMLIKTMTQESLREMTWQSECPRNVFGFSIRPGNFYIYKSGLHVTFHRLVNQFILSERTITVQNDFKIILILTLTVKISSKSVTRTIKLCRKATHATIKLMLIKTITQTSPGDDSTKRMPAKFCSVSALDRGNFYISINLA